MKRPIRRQFLLFLFSITFGLVGCGTKPAEQQIHAQFLLRARTVMGEPLANILVHTRGALQEEWKTDSAGLVTIAARVNDAQFTSNVDVGRSVGLQVDAACPEDFVGEAIHRKIPPQLLSSMAGERGEWSLELVCSPRHPKLPVAVLREGCGEVKVSVDGEELGTTSFGALHSLIDFPARTSIEFEFEPVEKNCQIAETKNRIVLTPEQTSLFVRVTSEPVLPKIRARSFEKPRPVQRPYRLERSGRAGKMADERSSLRLRY